VLLSQQQITGNIRGTVSDPSGAVFNLHRHCQAVGNRADRTATSDHSGNYLLVELPVGHYQLEVAAKGFQKYLQEGISLNVNETATVSVRLMLGQETEQVQVRADAELIQTTVKQPWQSCARARTSRASIRRS